LTILALAAGNGVARLVSRFSIIGGAQRIEYDLRNDLYARLQSFPPAFFAARPTGDIMTRATSDVSAVKSVVGFGLVSLAGTVFAFGGAIASMVAVDPWLTLWALAPYPVLVLLVRRFNASVHERTEAVQDQLGVLSARVQERLAGMSVVRAYTMEPAAIAEFGRANDEYLRRSLDLGRMQARFDPLMGLISGVGLLIVLWIGGRDVVQGRLTLGALVAFNGYLAYLTWPTAALGWTLSMVRRGLTSMARIQAITDAPVPPDGVRRATAGPPSIRFEGLSFAYPRRGPALVDVSFSVAPGETVAVVGHTGSGKSTLGLLTARLWEPPPGTVFIGGTDVRDLERTALREMVGYVPQEAFLFSRSILDNVGLDRDDVDLATARSAAATAGVNDEVEGLPQGWDTVVGERGLTVSGGQRQRLALARALAVARPVLVLDDVFASVDTLKEDEILARLGPALAGRTVLMMTHRLRAARAADRIVVLSAGRIVEEGPHDALVAANGLYAQLWRIQELEDEIARA
ncbi:MAG: ABC transporter ATP-binding protein, partial [Candidatus Rokubacteria bacterium]|nr:ABC transporter ATP-binding protein [Candidatus Rokubacteria bacterium]